jgi:uncharacterized protein YcbX
MVTEASGIGAVVGLWRYPVKSMQGEELDETVIAERGILGDRAYAVMDRATGHIASAKHPGKWSKLWACRAAYAEPPRPAAPLPPVWITLPDGTVISSAQPDIDRALSRALGRDVTLLATAPPAPTREANRAPVDGSGEEEIILEEAMALAAPAGTFFDYAPIHLLTTATLDRLRELYPAGRFEVRRFRPNIVVAPARNEPGFVENDWLGQTLGIGPEVQVRLIDPSPRCVVTTLAQADLPRDPGILRTIAQHNAAASATLAPGVVLPGVAGAYAGVLQPGVIRRGAPVRLPAPP